ncbi:MAG: hypothetical protein FWF81_08045 [Defluviitaleaceae bacterium]|nr:hypothetical protein [Defluviitaleaceae bacterium]
MKRSQRKLYNLNKLKKYHSKHSTPLKSNQGEFVACKCSIVRRLHTVNQKPEMHNKKTLMDAFTKKCINTNQRVRTITKNGSAIKRTSFLSKKARLEYINNYINDDNNKMTSEDLLFYDRHVNLSAKELSDLSGMTMVYGGMTPEESEKHFTEMLNEIEFM